MNGLRSIVLVLCLCGPGALVADEAAPAGKTPSASNPGGNGNGEAGRGQMTRLEVVYADGSKVRMTVPATSVGVATKYGLLTIPIRDVRRIRLRPRVSDDQRKRIAGEIAALGDNEFARREAAMANLKALGLPAIADLRRATTSTRAEIRQRAVKLLEEMEERIPAEDLEVAQHDVVETVEFTLSGVVATSSLKAHSKFLGDVRVSFAQLRRLRSLDAPSRLALAVDAAQYARHGQWMQAGVEIEPNDRIVVTAGGEIDLYPDDGQAGMYMSTPKGAELEELVGARGGAIKPGTLIGRIGLKGKEFVIGERYSAFSYESGSLFLHITPSPINGNSTGQYKVKIDVTKPATNQPNEQPAGGNCAATP